MTAILATISMALAVAAAVDAVNAEAPGDAPVEFRRVRLLAPNFPAACGDVVRSDGSAQAVTISFTISPGRSAANLEVASASHECFVDAAMAAIRTSVFIPTVSAPNWENRYAETVIFEFDPLEAAGARPDPIKRGPPDYPYHCFDSAAAYEAVLIGFDVNSDGYVENAHVIDSTYPCIERAALNSMRKWRYEPISETASALLTGQETVITFEVDNYTQWTRVRKAVVDKLSAAQKRLNKGVSATEILSDLEQIEINEGRTFVRGEVELFYAVRSNARVEVKDYAGALDDVRVAGRAGNMLVDWRNLASQREKLEAAIDEPKGWRVSEGAIRRFESADDPKLVD